MKETWNFTVMRTLFILIKKRTFFQKSPRSSLPSTTHPSDISMSAILSALSALSATHTDNLPELPFLAIYIYTRLLGCGPSGRIWACLITSFTPFFVWYFFLEIFLGDFFYNLFFIWFFSRWFWHQRIYDTTLGSRDNGGPDLLSRAGRAGQRNCEFEKLDIHVCFGAQSIKHANFFVWKKSFLSTGGSKSRHVWRRWPWPTIFWCQ